MIDYGQFCPVSKTAQIIGEKWTLLIIRELLRGASGARPASPKSNGPCPESRRPCSTRGWESFRNKA